MTTSINTITETSISVTTTFYAACDEANMASQIQCRPASNVVERENRDEAMCGILSVDRGIEILDINARGAYECCVKALLHPAGAWWVWQSGTSHRAGRCLVAAGKQCMEPHQSDAQAVVWERLEHRTHSISSGGQGVMSSVMRGVDHLSVTVEEIFVQYRNISSSQPYSVCNSCLPRVHVRRLQSSRVINHPAKRSS